MNLEKRAWYKGISYKMEKQTCGTQCAEEYK